MKILFSQKFNKKSDFLIRRCGYGQLRDIKTGEISYVRRLRSDFYPRFHLYINCEDPLILNLHLDQKKPSYVGTKAHGGDYDSELVKQEANRIYNQIITECKKEQVKQKGEEEKM